MATRSDSRARAALAAAAALASVVVGPRASAQRLDSAHAATAAAVGRPRAAAAPKRPDYQPLRFEERWPAMPAGPGADPFDPLKHVALSPGGAAYLTLGGQLRWRGESVSHFQLGTGADRRDAFGLARAAFTADLHLGGAVRAFGELRDASAAGRTLPGGARPQDADRWDAQNAFVEVTAPARLAGARLRAGRQEVSLGKERLVGLADWANARRSFDGVRLDARPTASLSVTMLRARPVRLGAERPNASDSSALLWGGLAATEVARRGVQLHALVVDQPRASLPGAGASATGAQHRVTVGGRVSGPVSLAAARWLTTELEGGAQRGHAGAQRIAAWYVVAELTATGASLPLRPALTLGWDRASGDRDSTDRATQTFVAPYPSAHTFSGYADVVGRQNLDDRRVVLAAQLPVLGAVRVAGHAFRRVSAADGAYTKNGGVLRAASGDASRAVGEELDVTTTRALGRHVRLTAGYAHFAAGAFLRHAAAGAHPVDWGFGGLSLTF